VAESTSSGKGDFGRRLAQKALMPIVATAASAVAGYVARQGPTFFEEKVLPKLKELADGIGETASNAPAKAKQAVGGAGDLAEGLTSRAKELANPDGGHRDGLSSDELGRHVQERAEARAARRNSTKRRR
jgi:hypothetical protein